MTEHTNTRIPYSVIERCLTKTGSTMADLTTVFGLGPSTMSGWKKLNSCPKWCSVACEGIIRRLGKDVDAQAVIMVKDKGSDQLTIISCHTDADSAFKSLFGASVNTSPVFRKIMDDFNPNPNEPTLTLMGREFYVFTAEKAYQELEEITEDADSKETLGASSNGADTIPQSGTVHAPGSTLHMPGEETRPEEHRYEAKQ